MDIIKELQNSDFFIRPVPKDMTVTMAYVPYQNADKLYSPEHAIQMGTIFPELNKPFTPNCVNNMMERGEDDD